MRLIIFWINIMEFDYYDSIDLEDNLVDDYLDMRARGVLFNEEGSEIDVELYPDN
jgi:hypothetical protein